MSEGTLTPCERVAILYEKFGYWPEYEYEDLDLLDDWYCMGPGCGQPYGKPHLDGCVVGEYYAGTPND